MSRFKIQVRNLLPLLVVALAGAAFLGAPSRADAAFKVRVLESTNSGATYSTVYSAVDEGAGDTFGAGDLGAISFKYTDANVAFSVTTAQSKPLVDNGPAQAVMDLSVAGTFTTSSGTVRIRIDITDTDFGPSNTFGGAGIFEVKLGQTMGGAGTTWTGVINYGAGGNNEYGGIDAAGGSFIGPITATVGTPLVTAVGDTGSAPYSMSGRLEFGNSVKGFSSDDSLTFAPAPGGLVLVLAALPALGVGAWFRRRRTPTVA